MLQIESLDTLRGELKGRLDEDRALLEEMRDEVRPLKFATRKIQPRSATAVSLVGTDGGNNQIRFDPFQVELVRVVDSSDNEYCLEVITPRTPISDLSKRHVGPDGMPRTSLGKMMKFLGVSDLADLSPVFKHDGEELAASWTNVYREMTEWAVLLELVREKDFGADTVIVRDGFLRSKMFKGDLFGVYRRGLEEGIRRQFDRGRRRVYVCGIAKRSKVLQAYRIAMAVEGVMRTTYPAFVEVPESMEDRVYKWDEYYKRQDKFVAGKMFLVKFGNTMLDPIWATDILTTQKGEAQTILGYLLEDAKDGFPVPFYPQCLQKAHENAALVDFDLELLENSICDVLRQGLGNKKWIIDELSLQETDPAARRYN